MSSTLLIKKKKLECHLQRKKKSNTQGIQI